MKREELIPLSHFCEFYNVEMTFFTQLNEYGLIEIHTIETLVYVHEDETNMLEKMIRMHNDLHLNFEGIDTVLHLLTKIESLQNELLQAKNKLRLYEE